MQRDLLTGIPHGHKESLTFSTDTKESGKDHVCGSLFLTFRIYKYTQEPYLSWHFTMRLMTQISGRIPSSAVSFCKC